MKLFASVLTAALLASAGALAQTPSSPAPAPTSGPASAPPPAAPPAAAPPPVSAPSPSPSPAPSAGVTGAQDFAAKAEGGNQYEIDAGRLAESQGRNRYVKTFGRDMVRDHTRLGRQVTAAFKQDKGANLPTSTPVPSDLQQKIDQLKSERGAAFDRDYAQQMLQTHQQTVAMFESYVKNGDDKVVKATARKALPLLREHLRMAERLNRQVGAKS